MTGFPTTPRPHLPFPTPLAQPWGVGAPAASHGQSCGNVPPPPPRPLLNVCLEESQDLLVPRWPRWPAGESNVHTWLRGAFKERLWIAKARNGPQVSVPAELTSEPPRVPMLALSSRPLVSV